jgi:hydroxyethylthiazole kinase-like uncharacterized protein yjeF
MRVLTVSQMRQIDQSTVDRCGISFEILMETAGRQVLEAMRQQGISLQGGRFVVFCGRGNNGGDGAVIARHLWIQGASRVEVLLLGKVEQTSGEARRNLEILQRLVAEEGVEGRLQFAEWDGWMRGWEEAWSGEILIDALLGTGLTREVSGRMREVLDGLNRLRGQGATLVAVDLPSGLAGDADCATGPHLEADLTVTFTAPKRANVLSPAAGSNGKLVVAAIGTPDWLVTRELGEADLSVVEPEDVATWLKKTRRPWVAHKGDVGRVLLVAGSRGKTGAAAMAARSSLLAGAGLVTVATPLSVQGWLVGQVGPEIMTVGVAETIQGGLASASMQELRPLIERQSVLAIGPGLISSERESRALLRELVEDRQTPVIIDADGLNGLSPWPRALRGDEERPIVLTPHVGEMARLLETTTSDVLSDRVGKARALAVRQHVIVVLKGARTLIAAPDGKVWINPTGNAGMATAGAGDVLTGLLAGFLAPLTGGGEAIWGVIVGVYLHGLSGDFAVVEKGERSLLATDLQTFLPKAIRAAEEGRRPEASEIFSIRLLGSGRGR